MQLSALALVLGLGAAPAQAQDSYDHVVVILDASGSMSGIIFGRSKMDSAKEALHHVLGQVPDTTKVGLLVFSGKGFVDPWVYPLSVKDNTRLAQAISLPQPAGQTPLGKYIKIGADALLEERDRQHGYGTYRMLVVTDGEANDRHLVERYTPDVVARGIGLDVIGVDMTSTHTLKSMAHSYREARDPESLIKAVEEVFAEVSFDGDQSMANATFETIDGMEPDLAMAIIESMGSGGNHPIGERAPKPKRASVAPAGTEPPASPDTPSPAASTSCAIAGAVPSLGLAAIVAAGWVRRRED